MDGGLNASKKVVHKADEFIGTNIADAVNNSTVSKVVTKKWIEVNDLSSGQYSDNKNVRFKTSMWRSDLCDYSDACIVVKERISVKGTNNACIVVKERISVKGTNNADKRKKS